MHRRPPQPWRPVAPVVIVSASIVAALVPGWLGIVWWVISFLAAALLALSDHSS